MYAEHVEPAKSRIGIENNPGGITAAACPSESWESKAPH